MIINCKKAWKKIRSFIPESKRIISQFFETEWFYRWRKTDITWTDNKKNFTWAAFHLSNTWDGDISIINIIKDKIFHMYVNLRKNGTTLNRYLTIDSIMKKGTDSDKYWAFFKDLDKEYTEHESNNSIKTSYQRLQLRNPSDNKAELYFKKSVITDTHTKNIQTKYSLVIKESEKIIKPGEPVPDTKVSSKEIKFETKPRFDEIINQVYKTASIKLTVDDLMAFIVSVEVEPEDYKCISDGIKSEVIGRIPSLHKLWKFRRMLDKLMNMSDDDEPYNSEIMAAMYNQNGEFNEDAYKKAVEHFRNDKKKYARKVADFWCDYSETWWD